MDASFFVIRCVDTGLKLEELNVKGLDFVGGKFERRVRKDLDARKGYTSVLSIAHLLLSLAHKIWGQL